MNYTNYTPLIIIEILFTVCASLAIYYCDKRIIELHKKVKANGREIIEGIKNINRELVKVNTILETINKIRKVDWFKIIIKTLDIINIILILAPIGKKIPFKKKLLSLKTIKSIIGLGA